MTTLKYTSNWSLILLVLIACQSTPKNSSFQAEFNEIVADYGDDIKVEIEEIFEKLPPPSTIPSRIQSAGFGYKETLLLKPTELAKKEEVCMQIGALMVDVSYLVSYGKMQEAITTLDLSKELAGQIGITTAFDLELIERIEQNLVRPEKINEIIDAETKKTSKYLRSNYRTNDAAIVILGSMVEALYLTTQHIKELDNDADPVVQNSLRENLEVLDDVTTNCVNLLELVDSQNPSFPMLKEMQKLDSMLTESTNIEGLDLRSEKMRNIIEQTEEIRSMM